MCLPSPSHQEFCPTSQRTSGRSVKISAAVRKVHGMYMSSEFSHAMIPPVDSRMPRLIAATCPRFSWGMYLAIHGSYLRMIFRLPSVDPSSTTMYSRFGYPWSSTERIVASMKRA